MLHEMKCSELFQERLPKRKKLFDKRAGSQRLAVRMNSSINLLSVSSEACFCS